MLQLVLVLGWWLDSHRGEGGPVDKVRVKWDSRYVILVLLVGAQLDVRLLGTESILGGKLLLLMLCC